MSELQLPSSLVDVEWLHDHLDAPDLVIFDGSWHMPATGRDGFEEWRHEHIKNARFFDFDRVICAPQSELPHMMPNVETFTREVRKLGLNNDSVVVIYDSMGMFSAPRVWWMLRAMGFEQCALLDGGLPAWQRAGFDLENQHEDAHVSPGNFVARAALSGFANVEDVIRALQDRNNAVVDARPSPRFRGEVDEPRPGLRRGHMPGATNLPFADFFENGLLKPTETLKSMLNGHIAETGHTIFSCGSGVTACVAAFAAHLVGYENTSVYDGSWCEWGLPGELPVETDTLPEQSSE